MYNQDGFDLFGENMVEKKHKETTKQFLQKILLFIDTTMVGIASAKPEDSDRILVGALANIKDAIFSEIVRDNQIELFNEYLKKQEEDKKKLSEEDPKSLNQEIELDKDQTV